LSSASLLAPGLLHLEACPAPLDAWPAPLGVLALLQMVLSDHVGWGFGVVGV
jgi:hypothetical protein